MDMHDASQLGSRDFFSYDTMVITASTASVSDFTTDLKDFKQYLIVGRYLGGFSTGLSLL